MYIRNHEGKLVKFGWKKYRSEKQLYQQLWKIMYNVNLKENDKMNKYLTDYIRGKKNG
jgi:hypothetical protein